MTTLPPGVSATQFAKALKEFEAAVGAEWVFSKPEDVELYRDAYSIFWGEAEERVASAAVAPASVEEVQKIVRIANKYKIPLYAISTGKNLTYGGSAPNYSGSVVLDLKRMNRVLEVDDKRNFALVEPGVSYFDLYRYIQEKGLKVWLDIPDPGWGSVMGNALDHGIGYTMAMHRDHFGSHCGMEVVLANGDIVRTGMGALPGAQSWQDYRYGYGPYVDGLFSQGNYGIVTKMGFWLLPQPESFLEGQVMVPRYQDLGPLVEQVNYLEDSFLIGQPQYGSPAGGPFFLPPSPRLVELMASGWPSPAAIDKYIENEKKPAWNVNLHFYGPPATVQANWEYAKQRIAAAIPGTTFKVGDSLKIPLTPEQEKKVQKTAFGIPSMSVFSLVARNPGNNADPPFGHADFTCIIPRTGQAVINANKVFYDAFAELGYKGVAVPEPFTPFVPPTTWHPRTFLMAPIVWTYKDPERNKIARKVFSHLIDVAAKHGWAEYRTAPAFQDQLAAQYSFGDHALLRFQETLKDAVDPNGILSPGRGGVWPKHLRRARK